MASMVYNFINSLKKRKSKEGGMERRKEGREVGREGGRKEGLTWVVVAECIPGI